ncbi:hypothetical protein P8A21_03505 [Streptomyces poriferorum]|uniref:hypothetical protein n=1 Tax=Streptomyces poriferorum TaxID=2798799 RepID=UPI00273D5789|nr:hypothetical protein [Streptomyces sp. Alt1]WLQ46623.1 hypothetical protein P8A21_03505 [Streptomyces sp. Alt1]
MTSQGPSEVARDIVDTGGRALIRPDQSGLARLVRLDRLTPARPARPARAER